MSILTNWGYNIPKIDVLETLLPLSEFNALTANKYAADGRAQGMLADVSQTVRDYCGWHLTPAVECEFDTTFFDRRVTKVSGGVLIQLPARYVSAVKSIEIGGETVEQYVLQPNGILLVNACGGGPYTAVKVTYTAGLPDSIVGTIQGVVANRAVKSLSMNGGVQSETAGGVSISYSSTYMNDASGSGLTATEKEALAPYKLTGVF